MRVGGTLPHFDRLRLSPVTVMRTFRLGSPVLTGNRLTTTRVTAFLVSSLNPPGFATNCCLCVNCFTQMLSPRR